MCIQLLLSVMVYKYELVDGVVQVFYMLAHLYLHILPIREE